MREQSSFFTYPPIESEGVQHKARILLHACSPKWIVANRTTLEIARSLDRGEPDARAAGTKGLGGFARFKFHEDTPSEQAVAQGGPGRARLPFESGTDGPRSKNSSKRRH